MHNYRELELHGIIKTLESKVNTLKHQIDHAESREAQKIAAAVSKEKKIIGEKDKTIAMLMEESRKLREKNNLKHSQNIARIEDQYRSREESTVKLQTSNMDLESKLKQLSKYNQDKIKQKEKELQQTKNQLKKMQKERKAIIDEVQKMNKFSVEAVRRQPERQQTLLWVNKLIQFISKTNDIVANENKQREQMLLSITLHISQELRQLNTQYSKLDSTATIEKFKFLEEMQNMISQVELDCKEATRANQQFWEGFSRVRNKQEKQYISKLQNQLQTVSQSKEKQLNQLKQQLSAVDKQKKSLLVNLQQLKCFYQLRQRAYKEEVDYFKKSIEDLIQSQQIREEEYQRQISRMGEQIQHLTVKFYEKVQLPINTVYSRIKDQVGKFQHHYQIFFTNSHIQNQIKQFQAVIVDYLMRLNQDKQLRQIVKDAAKQTDKICQFLSSHYKGSDQQSNVSAIDPNISFSFSSNVTEQNREQDNKKLVYELATAKKHIQKLKDHIRNLEGKYANSRVASNQVNTKILQLSAQNQLLKDQIQKLQKKQHDKQMYSDQMLEESRIGKINTALLEQVVLKNSQILRYVRNQDEYLGLLTKCVDSLNAVILSPVQTFQHLIDQIKSISTITIVPPRREQHPQVMPSLDEMKAKRLVYEQIVSRKNDAGASIVKATSEMTKVVREILGKNNTSKQSKQSQNLTQREKPKFTESRQMLEKRAKQIHVQRLKIREEMLERILILDDKVKHIDQKANKKHNFPFIRFQESICKKLTQLFGTLMPKDRLKDFKKITEEALNDATTKLIDCKLENQGLMKELNILRLVNQK